MNTLDFLHLLKNQCIFNVYPIPAAMAKVTFKPSGGIPYSRPSALAAPYLIRKRAHELACFRESSTHPIQRKRLPASRFYTDFTARECAQTQTPRAHKTSSQTLTDLVHSVHSICCLHPPPVVSPRALSCNGAPPFHVKSAARDSRATDAIFESASELSLAESFECLAYQFYQPHVWPGECWPVVDFALLELVKTKGYSIIIGSVGAQMHMPFASSYVVSKHALNRFNEYIHAEHPEVKIFSLNPGAIKTSMAENNPEAAPWLIDTLQLPAATCLRLTSGREDWLTGRYVSANWNLDEVESDWKTRIIEQEALVNRLHIPL
ncbi:hypothetical protein C8R44DRAFT_865984 [Mycena epipterygia]|nr:hypothetical protein C8R44DRAFT_865984 [Mycena epipterygia]